MSRLLAAVLAAISVAACGGGGDPALYLVAIDLTPLSQLPGTCFTTGLAPTSNQSVSGVFEQQQWTYWGGPDAQYLEVPGFSTGQVYRLGDADWVNVRGLIGGKDGKFQAQRVTTENQSQSANARTETLAVETTGLGDTLKGSVVLTVANTCIQPTCPNTVNCQVSLPLSGRRIPPEHVQFTP